MKIWKGTKGKWSCISNGVDKFVLTVLCKRILTNDVSFKEQFANAELIVDAGNTVQLSNMLPSEVWRKYNVLLKASE